MKTKKFPVVVYARWEGATAEEPFLIVDYPEAGGVDGEKVAIYELREVKTKKVYESLEY